MKTIYTDRYGIYPWTMLVASCWMFLLAYGDLGKRSAIYIGLDIAGGLFFMALAVRRLVDIRRAKREGRDHTIVRVKAPVP